MKESEVGFASAVDFGEESVPPSEVVDRVQKVTLPDRVERVAEEYDKSVGVRNRYLWKWIYSLLPAYRLSSVPDKESSHVREEKTLLTIFVTVLDDIAEQDQDMRTFHEARRCVAPGDEMDTQKPSVDTAALEFLEMVWREFKKGFTVAPCYSEQTEIFRFDLRQTLNAIEHSWLVTNTPEVATLRGSKHYAPHNMMLFSYVDVDLAHSVAFDPSELSALRELVWKLQQLARIGNWISTWEREVREGDYSSGVVLRALDRGLITRNELADPDVTSDVIIQRVQKAGIEEELIGEWKATFETVRSETYDIDSVDVDSFIRGLRTVLSYQVGSQGYK